MPPIETTLPGGKSVPAGAALAALIIAAVAVASAVGQCAHVNNPFLGGALTYQNLLSFGGGALYTNASGTVSIGNIAADAVGTSATRCRYEFVGPTTTSRIQLRFSRSTLGNNSIMTLHDGEGNPFAPAVGVFYGHGEDVPSIGVGGVGVGSVLGNQSGLSGYGLPAYYVSSSNRVGLFVLKSDGLIDAQLLYIISDTAANRTKSEFVLINDETSFVMVVSTMVLSALRVLGQYINH